MVSGQTGKFRVLRRWAETSAILISVVMVMIIISGPAGAQTNCGSLQARINSAAAGATIDLPDGCIYREQIVIDEPLTLKGGRGVEIRGSNIWTGWTRSGSRWQSNAALPKFEGVQRITDPQHPYPCKDGTSRCKWPAQVFLDGRPLLQVRSDPRSGQFAVTRARKVILGSDPRGHRMEVTVRRRWVDGKARNVVISGFTMKHAANGLSNTAIDNNGHQDWTIRDNDLSYAHAAILSLGSASGLRIEGNNVHHGGLLGISSANANVTVLNNQVHDNNTEAFYPAWKSAGMKIANASSVVATGNVLYNNDQTGIWVDNGSENITLSGNRVHHNAKRGIHIEVSDRARVFNNVIWENGWGRFVSDASGNEGVGISTTASRGVQIYNNTLAWNASGIAVVNSRRTNGVGGSSPIFSTVSNVLVHDNKILAEERPGLADFALIWRRTYSGGNLYNPAANNRGYDNRYWYTGPEGLRRHRFVWVTRLDRLPAFNLTGGEERGRYLSSTEKGSVVAAARIPASPERH